MNGLETPRHTSAYTTRGFLCTSVGTGCSQNVEGCPSKRQGIFLGRNWDGHIESVYQYPNPERFMSQLFHEKESLLG